MRKPAFCICENKDVNQLRGNRKADQRLCFRYTDSTIPLLPKSEVSSLYPSSVSIQPGLCRTGQKNENRFSQNEAKLCKHLHIHKKYSFESQRCVRECFCIKSLLSVLHKIERDQVYLWCHATTLSLLCIKVINCLKSWSDRTRSPKGNDRSPENKHF